MLKAIRMMSILLAANAEAVILIFVAWWVGKFLNETYPSTQINWLPICFVVAIVLISYSWVLILRPMFKDMTKNDQKKTE